MKEAWREWGRRTMGKRDGDGRLAERKGDDI
jgi:hypothetical protein